MAQSFLSRATLVVLTSALAVLGVACSEDKQTTATRVHEQPQPVDNVAAPPVVEASPSSPEPQPQSSSVIKLNSFEMALDKAAGAMTIGQSAQSPDDWKLVASQFQDAIALMQNVKQDSPNFTVAQIKISEYQRRIKNALDKANPKPLPPVAAKPQRVVVVVPAQKTTPTSSQPLAVVLPKPQPSPKSILLPTQPVAQEQEDVFIAPIKRRIGGTPIIDVTFNGDRKFEMIVDTGASGTVITQNMADALGIVPVGKTKANTASSRAVEFTIGYVDSMAAAGVTVNKLPVAIAGSDLETGLLGHDFFGNYDVTIRRNVVEFRPQSHAEINSVETGLTAPTLPKERHYLESP